MNWKDWVPTAAIVLIVGAAIVWWQSSSDDGAPPPANVAPEADRFRPCRDLQGETPARLRACLDQLPGSNLSDPATQILGKIHEEGGVLSVARVDPGFAVKHLSESPNLEPLMLGTDEQPAAKALHELGVRGVVVSRDLTGALDRDDAVLARLAYHDFVEWFQLRYVTEDLLIYTVRNSPARVPVATGDELLKGLRARLEGRSVPRQSWTPEAVRLLGSMRLQGKTLASRHVVVGEDAKANGPALERALDELAAKLARDWERKVETEGMGRLHENLPRVRLEVQVVMEKAPVEPRSRYSLFDLWEMGVDGMIFRQREPEKGETLDEKFTFLPGSELVARSLHSPDEFLRTAVKEFGWSDDRPWEKDPRTRLDIIRTQHFAESVPGGGPAIRFVRGMPEVPMSWVTEKNVQDMLIAGGEWWLANQYPDGSFEYKYWPEQNRRSDDYNEVRHILAARDLADTWRYRNDPRYLAGSRKAMDWLLQFEVDASQAAQGPLPHPPEGTMLFRYPTYAKQTAADPANQKLGTVAVGLLGWIAWAEATGSHGEDARIRKMAKFVQAMQEPDGRFRPYFVNSGHRYEQERNDIVPGEAMLALGKTAQYFGEPDWVQAYGKFVEYYQPWFRTRAVRRVPTGRWPQDIYGNQDRLDLVQFGPWSVMAARQVYLLTGDQEAAKFGLEVADWMIDSYQWTEARSPWPDYVGGYYKLPEELPAMQTFCYSEGTAAAYALASKAAPDRAAKYEAATRQSIRFLEVMMFDDLDSYAFARPEKIRGGIKYTMNENKVRIDYVGHGLSTLSQYLDARRGDPAVASTVEVWDPTDLQRPAGKRGSVPGLDYAEVPVIYPSGEYPGPGPVTVVGAPAPLPPELPAMRPDGGGGGDADDREDD